MNQVDQDQSGRLLSIGQVTALTGVGRSTLRHWETEFKDFLNSVRTKGNQRRFTRDAVRKIEKIKELVESDGLTLKGVRRRLENIQITEQVESDWEPAKRDNINDLADLVSEHIIRRLFQDR